MNDWVTNLTQDLPVWAVPAAIVHIALFLALIIPTWRALARARAGGPVSLVLILPGLGLLIIAIMMLAVVLRRANWSPAWFILVLIPVVNIVFLWMFAFASWSERAPKAASVPPPEEPWEPAPHAPPLDDEAATPREPKTKPPKAREPTAKEVDTERPASRDAAPSEAPPSPPSDPEPDPVPPPPPPASEKEVESDLTLVARAPDVDPDERPERPGRTVPGGPRDAEKEEEPVKTEPPKKQPAPKGRAWQLTGANDRAAGLDFAVFEEDLRQAENGLHIGRSTRSNIILEDESVSRNHARLILADGDLRVEDLDSMNGTWVDGDKAESGAPLSLVEGTEVEFGKLKLVVKER